MDRKEWMDDYEAEYLRVNGKKCEIRHRGSGWYEVVTKDTCSGPHRGRKILEMTETLKGRIGHEDQVKI